MQRVKNFRGDEKVYKKSKINFKNSKTGRELISDKLKFIIITLTLLILFACDCSGFAALLTYYRDSRIVNDGLTVIMVIDKVCLVKKP